MLTKHGHERVARLTLDSKAESPGESKSVSLTDVSPGLFSRRVTD
jgi:hypothetical protein